MHTFYGSFEAMLKLSCIAGQLGIFTTLCLSNGAMYRDEVVKGEYALVVA